MLILCNKTDGDEDIKRERCLHMMGLLSQEIVFYQRTTHNFIFILLTLELLPILPTDGIMLSRVMIFVGFFDTNSIMEW